MMTLVCCGLSALAGCRNPQKSSENMLRPPRVAADSTELDLFFITLPEQTAETTYASIWRDADVQQIDPETRRRQLMNGLQVGVLGWRLPPEIQHLIEDRSQPLAEDIANRAAERSAGANMMEIADLEKLNRISIRRMTVQHHHRNEIIVSREFETFTLLLSKDGNVSGGDYPQSQGIFGVRAARAAGGKVRLEFDPELQFGASQQKWNATTAGITQLTSSREKVPLDVLAFACELTPGEFVAVGSLPGKPGSVGDRFFEDHTGTEPRRRLLLIRVARAAGSELFGGLDNAGN